MKGRDLPQTAAFLAEKAPDTLSSYFADSEIAQLREAWSGSFHPNSDEWGAASRPRPVGVDLEVVAFVRKQVEMCSEHFGPVVT